jgi:hypothetical protein
MIRPKRMTRIILLVAALTLPAFSANSDRPRVRLGGVSAGFGYWSGPAFGPYAYGPYPYLYGYRPWWGLYDPFWSNPWLHSGLYRGFAQGPGMGQIKLDANKDASVYVDGAFAGPAGKLKSMWLEPGIYELQVVSTGGEEYRRKVYVLSGKTLNIKTGVRP